LSREADYYIICYHSSNQ